LADIQEPLKTCAADTTSAKICGPDWPRQHEILKCAYTKADAGADAGTIPDAGPIVPPAPPPDDCDCSTPGAVRGGSFAMVLAAAAMFVFRLRRKRR
jgi:MYXO-CTERM domain-containing protein